MAAKTWYATSSLASVHQEMSETDPGTEAYASPVTGWICGTGATNRSPFNSQVEQASATFVGTTDPDGSIDTTNGDCLRTSNTYNGSFASANWTVNIRIRANTAGDVTFSGRAYCRLFRGANADGSGATQITSAAQQGTVCSGIVTTSTKTSSIVFNPGSFTVTSEYIFVQLAWERTAAGAMSTSDVNLRIGNASSGGTLVLSADFTPAAVVTPQSVSGSLSFVGADTFKTFTTLTAGALAFAGAFTRARLFLQSFTATLFSTPSYNDGDPVSIWSDASGNNNDATQSTGTNQPIFKTNIINGKPVVRFDGTNDYLVAPNGAISSITSGVSVFLVQKVNVVQNALVFEAIPSVSNNRFAYNVPWGDGTLYFAFGDPSGTGLISTAWGGNTTDFFVWSLGQGAGGMAIYRNGTAIATNANTNTFAPGSKTLAIGSDLTYFHNADIAEIIVYNVGVSSTDRSNIEKYLADKYGLTVAGGAAVDPSTVTGLQVWFKADEPISAAFASLSLKPLKSLAGTLSFAGALIRRITKALMATLSFIGALTKRIIDAGFTAALSFIGTLTSSKLFVRALTATLSFVGAVTRRTNKLLAGALSFIGNLTRSLRKTFSAAVSFVGSLTKKLLRTLTAALSFIGNLATQFTAGAEVFFQSVFGTLAFVGAQTKRTSHRLTGTLSFIGATIKRIPRQAFTAAVSFVGTFAKLPKKALAGAVSFIGTITRKTFHRMASILSFVGNFQSLLSHIGENFLSLSANLSFVGALPRRTRTTLSSILSFVGSLGRRIPQRLTGALSFVGLLAKRGGKRLTGTVSFVGALTRTAAHLFSLVLPATLAFVGAMTARQLFGRIFTATLNASGALTRRTAKMLSASLASAGVLMRGMARNFSATLAFVGFLFRGGLTFFYGGQIAGSTLHITITGSTARIVRAGSDLEIHRNLSGVSISVTGSTLRVERTT